MAQIRAATGGMAAGMSANAAATQLMIAAAAGGQSYQYAALGTSQLLTQDSGGIGFPVSSHVCHNSFSALTLLFPTSNRRGGGFSDDQLHDKSKNTGVISSIFCGHSWDSSLYLGSVAQLG